MVYTDDDEEEADDVDGRGDRIQEGRNQPVSYDEDKYCDDFEDLSDQV